MKKRKVVALIGLIIGKLKSKKQPQKINQNRVIKKLQTNILIKKQA